MAMRMNASQEEKAREAGGSSFRAGLYMNYKLPHEFPIDTPLQARESLDVFPHSAYWEDWFKRKDISAANLVVLKALWLEGYTEAYATHMFEAMTPETLESHKWKLRNLRGGRLR